MLDLKKLSEGGYSKFPGRLPSSLYLMSKDPDQLLDAIEAGSITRSAVSSNLKANVGAYLRKGSSSNFNRWIRPHLGIVTPQGFLAGTFVSAYPYLDPIESEVSKKIHPYFQNGLYCKMASHIILGATHGAPTKKPYTEIVERIKPLSSVEKSLEVQRLKDLVSSLTEVELERIMRCNVANYPKRGVILLTRGVEFTRQCFLSFLDELGEVV